MLQMSNGIGMITFNNTGDISHDLNLALGMEFGIKDSSSLSYHPLGNFILKSDKTLVYEPDEESDYQLYSGKRWSIDTPMENMGKISTVSLSVDSGPHIYFYAYM